MRSRLGKAVRDRFRKQLNQRLPGFRELRDAEVPPGWLAFGVEVTPDLVAYIVLAIFREDSFTVEGAWSRNGRFPGLVGLLWPKSFPAANIHRNEAHNGDFRFRLATLWKPQDHSWDLVPRKSWEDRTKEWDEIARGSIPEEPSLERAMTNVIPMVDDVIDRIERHLLPYFDQVAEASGHSVRVSDVGRRPPCPRT